VRSLAATAVGQLGPAAREAIPSLLKSLKDSNRSVRINAAIALGLIHEDPTTVVPALINILRQEDRRKEGESLRGFIAFALSNFGPAAKDAVPDLVRIAKSGKDGSPMATEAVLAIDPEAAAIAGISTNAPPSTPKSP
jgi:HEAT repeat protein